MLQCRTFIDLHALFSKCHKPSATKASPHGSYVGGGGIYFTEAPFRRHTLTQKERIEENSACHSYKYSNFVLPPTTHLTFSFFPSSHIFLKYSHYRGKKIYTVYAVGKKMCCCFLPLALQLLNPEDGFK